MNEFDNVIIGMNKEEIYTLILKIEKLKKWYSTYESIEMARRNRPQFYP